MKKNLHFIALSPIIVTLLIASLNIDQRQSSSLDNEDISVCGDPGGIVQPQIDGKFISALSGWGDLNYKITTSNDSAQFYFNQGLSFYYGYHFTEALASFKEASRMDPTCGMAYWGQALSMGPFYNTYLYKMKKEVPEAISLMLQNSSAATERENGLMEALQKRYSQDLSNADRIQLDKDYALALSSLEKKYAGDNNIKALYIDAVMLQHKWDFWDHDGTARPWTSELVSLCEVSLKTSNHPAILHYYIHLTEASRQAGRALAAADKLKAQQPGIGHMIHMASHMYQRNGLYAKGVEVNDVANAANNDVDSKVPNLHLGKDRSPHFFAVQSFCAMNAGMYNKGLPIYQRARERQLALSDNMEKDVYAQFVYMIPVMAKVRLGKWDEIVQSAEVDGKWKYAVVLDNFAKGMASIHNKNLEGAKRCLNNIDVAIQDSTLSVRLMPFNSPIQSCRIASSILKAAILFEDGKKAECLAAFQQAMIEEDHMVYREPQDWLIPVRQYLGSYLLKMNSPLEAEKVYLQDLVINPGNGWSLVGLYQSLTLQKKEKPAAVYKTKYQKAFEASDVKIESSVF